MTFDTKKFYKILLGIILLIGAVLRICVYSINRSLWHDECSLAVNILNGNIFSYFGQLEHLQSAPPIFMICSKLLYNIFPTYPELALRFIPLVASLVSIWIFYLLLKKFISNKYFILIGMFLFSINFQLIYYAQEFKQYSTDVLMVLLALLFYSHFDYMISNLKQKFIFAITTASLPFISLPTIFVIASAFIINCYKAKKEKLKSLFLSFLPAIVLNLLYFLVTLLPSKRAMIGTFSEMWGKGFLSFDLYSDFLILKNNLQFFFNPCNFYILALILIITGIVYSIKRKSLGDKYLLLTSLFIVLASFLQIYPIKERVSLYLIPILLIFILQSIVIDFKAKKIQTIITVLIFAIFFSGYNHNYLKGIYKHPIFERKDSRSVVLKLKEMHKADEWIVINDASDSDFEFYGTHFKFITPYLKFGRIAMQKYDKNWYFEILSSLPKGNKYWFCYPYDYVNSPAIPFLKEWIRTNAKILYEYEKDSSYLVLVEY